MKNYLKKSFISALSVFIITVSFFAGVYVSANRGQIAEAVKYSVTINSNQPKDVDFETFWKVWKLIDSKYVSEKTASTTTSEEKVFGAIKGLVESLGDPYSEFLPPEDNVNLQTELSGSLEGIGIFLGIRDSVLTVISPMKGTPAFRAGMREGDVIIKINDIDATKMSVEEAVSLIRGKKGTKVNITVKREGSSNSIDFSITRESIIVPTVETTKRDDGVFVVKVYSFNANVTTMFRNAMKEFQQTGFQKMIIDLRGNPGGYLDAAIEMASWFIPTGKIIAIEDFGGKEEDIAYRSKGYNAFGENPRIVILVNGGSASASEIVSGALRDHQLAILVGTKTFGKGSVQELVPVTEKTALKITIARWLTPSGASISVNGLLPDYEVKIDDDDLKHGRDPQLDKAIELLR